MGFIIVFCLAAFWVGILIENHRTSSNARKFRESHPENEGQYDWWLERHPDWKDILDSPTVGEKE